MTEEQKQIVLDKCATEKIRKDAELLFEVLEQAGIKYGPGELDLSAKVDEFDFENYLPKEHAEYLRAWLKQGLNKFVPYDIWIPSKGWAFDVEPIDKNNVIRVDTITTVDFFPGVRNLIRDANDLGMGFIFEMMKVKGYDDEDNFYECIQKFVEFVVNEYSYPSEPRNSNPSQPRVFFPWPPIGYRKAHEIEEDHRVSGLINGFPREFYKALLGEETYREISKKRQEQYLATHPECEQRFFEAYNAILGQPTIDKNKVISAVKRGVDLHKALCLAEKPIDAEKAHRLALKAIREINPGFDRAGLYNDMNH